MSRLLCFIGMHQRFDYWLCCGTYDALRIFCRREGCRYKDPVSPSRYYRTRDCKHG